MLDNLSSGVWEQRVSDLNLTWSETKKTGFLASTNLYNCNFTSVCQSKSEFRFDPDYSEGLVYSQNFPACKDLNHNQSLLNTGLNTGS